MNGSRILKKRKKSVELSLSERMFNNFKLNIKLSRRLKMCFSCHEFFSRRVIIKLKKEEKKIRKVPFFSLNAPNDVFLFDDSPSARL